MHVLLRLTFVFLLCWTALFGQSVNDVSAYRAKVEMTSHRGCNVVVLTVRALDRGETNPLVYVLQVSKGEELPESYRGEAQLFFAYGLVGVKPTNARGILFRFPELGVPDHLLRLYLKRVDTFGIAEYGAEKALSAAKMQELKNPTGCAARLGDDVPAPDCSMACTAGGPGAVSCSSGDGRCSITCGGGGGHACCNVHTNTCACCASNQ